MAALISSGHPKGPSNGHRPASKGRTSMSSSPSSMKAPTTNRIAASSSAPASQRKRARFTNAHEFDDDEEDEDNGGDGDSTEEEIEAARARTKSKTSKRKRRAVSPTAFGEALDAFLGGGDGPLLLDQVDGGDEDEAQASSQDKTPVSAAAASSSMEKLPISTSSKSMSAPIFALAPAVRSRISSTTLSAKAARVALEERRAREARWRVRDVIGAWGRPGQRPGEEDAACSRDDEEEISWQQQGGSKGYERKLRKVAQRGVVKLFNAIRAAQSTPTDDLDAEDNARRGGVNGSGSGSITGNAARRPRSAGQGTINDVQGGSLSGRNALGGKSREVADLSKANFLDLIRSGCGSAKAKPAATAAAR